LLQILDGKKIYLPEEDRNMTCLRGQLFEGEDTKNCSSCCPRERINDLNNKLHSSDEFGNLIFIVDEREEKQMLLFRYLAEMLMPNVSSRSTFFLWTVTLL
jgi:hypothetical protein